jgi:hypothetical protein
MQAAGIFLSQKEYSILRITFLKKSMFDLDKLSKDEIKSSRSWSAESFDTCLLLAAIYPLGTLFLSWGIYGNAAEGISALGFIYSISIQWRILMVAIVILQFYIGWNLQKWPLRQAVGAVALALAASFTASFGLGVSENNAADTTETTFVALAFCTAGAVVARTGGASSILFACCICGSQISAFTRPFQEVIARVRLFFHDAYFFSYIYPVIVIIVLAFFALLVRSVFTKKALSRTGYIFLATAASIFLVAVISKEAPPIYEGDPAPVALSLFLVVLPLINAAFDWFSVGLTRMLIRQSLSQRGFYPVVYAIGDLIISCVVLIALVITLVYAVKNYGQIWTIDDNPVIRVEEILQRLRCKPTSYSNMWIYVSVLSTLVPSVINIMIGSASLCREFGPLARLISTKTERAPQLDSSTILWISAALSAQYICGAIIGAIACLVSFEILLNYVLPFIWADLSSVAEAIGTGSKISCP